jgi:hypothetical protein
MTSPWDDRTGQAPPPGPPAVGAPQWGPPGPTEPPPRPGPLTAAVRLMWVGAGWALLSMLSTFFFLDDVRDQVEEQLAESGQRVSESTVDAALAIGLVVGVLTGVATAAVWIWMAVMNGRGRSWARVVATMCGGLGIVFALVGLAGGGFGARTTPLSLATAAVNLVLAGVVLALLWNGRNAAYYRAHS